MSDEKEPFFEDEKGEHILVPEGETIEHVVDDIHAGEAPDGIKSDILQQALADKEHHEDSLPDGIPIFLMGVGENDGVNYSSGDLALDGSEETGLTASVIFDNPSAFEKLKEVLGNGNLDAISFLVTPEEMENEPKLTLEDEITTALNRYSAENDSGTPDFILAQYLMTCLDAYNNAIAQRAQWRGKPLDQWGYEAGTNELFPDGSVINGVIDLGESDIPSSRNPE